MKKKFLENTFLRKMAKNLKEKTNNAFNDLYSLISKQEHLSKN